MSHKFIMKKRVEDEGSQVLDRLRGGYVLGVETDPSDVHSVALASYWLGRSDEREERRTLLTTKQAETIINDLCKLGRSIGGIKNPAWIVDHDDIEMYIITNTAEDNLQRGTCVTNCRDCGWQGRENEVCPTCNTAEDEGPDCEGGER